MDEKATGVRHSDGDYAASLYRAVFGKEDGGDCNPGAVLAALSALAERERLVLELRHRHGKTLAEAGKELGVTNERVRQIETKAIRKLRHTSLSRDMSIRNILRDRDGYMQAAQEKDATIRELRRIIALSIKGAAVPEGTAPPGGGPLGMGISEAEFSVRTHNILSRAGYSTIGEICGIESISVFSEMRNFGRNSLAEVIGKMRRLGFGDWADSMEAQSHLFMKPQI